jgi:hypothetical protein
MNLKPTIRSLALVSGLFLLAAGALAQTPYLYEPCHYRVGLFFSSSPDDFEASSASTNVDLAKGEVVYLHLVILDAPKPISAYELQIVGIPAKALVASWIELPDAGYLKFGDTWNHFATFGFPQPNPDGVVYLGHWRLQALADVKDVRIQVLASHASSIEGDGPALVVDQQLVRANFTPYEFSGCREPLPPGKSPAHVATIGGTGVVVTAPAE